MYILFPFFPVPLMKHSLAQTDKICIMIFLETWIAFYLSVSKLSMSVSMQRSEAFVTRRNRSNCTGWAHNIAHPLKTCMPPIKTRYKWWSWAMKNKAQFFFSFLKQLFYFLFFFLAIWKLVEVVCSSSSSSRSNRY